MTQTENTEQSIFQEYYGKQTFIDRYETETDQAVDVIIPIIHTTELWEANLHSIYREIPVNRLIIGDGGCIDNSIDIAKRFPRVLIADHTDYLTLGYSIRKLIETVKTEWFIYLHSDVYLPPNWFETMNKNRSSYDWFECNQQITILADYSLDYNNKIKRPLSGSQMGRKKAFEQVLPQVDDDYLYRNEDIIFAHLIEKAGGRYGRVDETFHYHQLMAKKSAWQREISSVKIELKLGDDEKLRLATMQIHGLIKYIDPSKLHLPAIVKFIQELEEADQLNRKKFFLWIEETNPKWLPSVKRALFRKGLIDIVMSIIQWLKRLILDEK